MIRRWRDVERWIEADITEVRSSTYSMLSLHEVLKERREPLKLTGDLGEYQAITIKFSGEVLIRERDNAFKGGMFAAYPGDLVFSKIDARNGAIGLIPEHISKAVVTSEYPVFVPHPDKLRPKYLNHLLRAEHFKRDLQRKASGTSGRKRVTPDGFLSLKVPVPTLTEQDTLIAAYTSATNSAATLEQEAQSIETAGLHAFEAALGVVDPAPLPDRPLFVARFKDFDRWSHEGVLRTISQPSVTIPATWPITRLGDVVDDLENGWSPKCHDYPAKDGKWGVLKVGAVSFGVFEENQNKELPEKLKPRAVYEVKRGDVLISRANVVRYVGACADVENTRSNLMICDKIFRVVFRKDTKLLPQFLAEVMRLPSVREQIEAKLTGTSPTMKNISKPALLSLSFPLPDVEMQCSFVAALTEARQAAASKRSEAQNLRALAWTAFESALFE